MTGIAGVASPKRTELVNRMLDKMDHRGLAWRDILEDRGMNFGAIGLKIQ